MLDCVCLFEDNYADEQRKKVPFVPRKDGQIVIPVKEGRFDGQGVYDILSKVAFAIRTYGRACKNILFQCKHFQPEDKLTYILFECVIYKLMIDYRVPVYLKFGEVTGQIHTEGIRDSIIWNYGIYLHKPDRLQEKFMFDQTMYHFRRVITAEKSNGTAMSELLTDLKTFFLTSQIARARTDELANVICELADNVGEHTQSDCLIDIDLSRSPYFNSKLDAGECYAVNTVVLNFSNKCLYEDVQAKIEQNDFEEAPRYAKIKEAYQIHSKQFDDKYTKEDFYTVASFQDEISGRVGETATGGTGLTQLVKSLEEYSEGHHCYVLSGDRGVFFVPEYLERNKDNWIGFNKEKDFLKKIPDEKTIFRSPTFLHGTGYNFTLIYRKDEEL